MDAEGSVCEHLVFHECLRYHFLDHLPLGLPTDTAAAPSSSSPSDRWRSLVASEMIARDSLSVGIMPDLIVKRTFETTLLTTIAYFTIAAAVLYAVYVLLNKQALHTPGGKNRAVGCSCYEAVATNLGWITYKGDKFCK
jgi:hypothetical protein